MNHLPTTPLRTQGNTHQPSLAFFCVEVFVSLLLCAAFVAGVCFALINVLGRQATSPVAHAAALKHVQLHLSIVINQPVHKVYAYIFAVLVALYPYPHHSNQSSAP